MSRSASYGHSSMPLPPGEHTLVAEIGGRLCLRNCTDDGGWPIAVVDEGAWTTYVIEDILEAAL